MLHTDNEVSDSNKEEKKKQKMPKGRKTLIIILCVLLGLAIALTAAFFIMRAVGKSGFNPVILKEENVDVPGSIFYDEGRTVEYKGKKYSFNENIIPIALFGLDRSDIGDTVNKSGQSTTQNDMNMVAAFDTATGKMTLISVPRDMLAEVNIQTDDGTVTGIQSMQLCLAFSFGDGKEKSCENALVALKRLLCNIEIDRYAALDFNSIAALNDAVGGVDIVASETIGSFKEGERYHLVGNSATKYVHTRDTGRFNSDSSRRARQLQYMRAFGDKALASIKNDFSTVTGLYNITKEHSFTNVTLSETVFLASCAAESGNFSMDNIISVEGEAEMKDGFMIVHPDQTSVFEAVLYSFYNEI